VANFQQRPLGPARAEKLAAISTAIADARLGVRRGEPPVDEGLRLILAFRQIADPALRRELIEHAEDLARAVKGRGG
jgi:hypothetical protein